MWGLLAFGFAVDTADSGAALRWPELPIPVMVVPGGAAEVGILRALAHWQTVPGASVAFVAVPPGQTPRFELDAENYVWIAETWGFDANLLALTSHWSDNRGDMLAFDVQVNGTRAWALDGADGYDLEAAVTHEIGHALGLEHSEHREAKMYGSLAIGPAPEGLHPDDIAGARFLYPMGAGCSSVPVTPGTLVVALGLVAVGLRRRRQPSNRAAKADAASVAVTDSAAAPT